jgi:hypothetical protein
MKVGKEHCRDSVVHNLKGKPIPPSIGLMRRLQENEHSQCGCGGTWVGNGFTRMSSGQRLEHLVCSRCGHQWIG